MTGCTEEDPRCPAVARAVGRIAVSEAEKHYNADGEEMKSVKQQVEAQQAKVTGECSEKLANDPTGIWRRWADCMSTVSTAEEARTCKDP